MFGVKLRIPESHKKMACRWILKSHRCSRGFVLSLMWTRSWTNVCVHSLHCVLCALAPPPPPCVCVVKELYNGLPDLLTRVAHEELERLPGLAECNITYLPQVSLLLHIVDLLPPLYRAISAIIRLQYFCN